MLDKIFMWMTNQFSARIHCSSHSQSSIKYIWPWCKSYFILLPVWPCSYLPTNQFPGYKCHKFNPRNWNFKVFVHYIRAISLGQRLINFSVGFPLIMFHKIIDELTLYITIDKYFWGKFITYFSLSLSLSLSPDHK